MANRRNILIGSGAALVAAASGTSLSLLLGATAAQAQQIDQAKLMAPAGNIPDRPLGNKDAKVTVIEYLSPSCPHCKVFALDVYPQLKAEYIDTGKIQFIARPFMRNVLDAVVFMLAEAAGDEKYHDVIDTFFKTQDQWLTSNAPNDALFAVAQQLGFTKESYDAALTNQDLFAGLEALQKQALDEFQLQGTPTFYVNGKKLTGENSFEALKAEIDPLLG
ncbi:DsbA family protein [Devosia sp. ZB163]|uniref:DsbA family protein n=1 Tax=Devosia sp. ZB163 TaxID=3025938 RepID=UPI00235EC98B|nr:DsbA family protein [Devosia sp. ZB163]MDC9823651.1 DsbA family protein [Devosia sp. ZB163]